MLNDNLEAQTQAFFDSLFITDAEPDCTLADIALVNPTRALAKNTEAKCFDMSTLPTKGCIPEGEIIKLWYVLIRILISYLLPVMICFYDLCSILFCKLNIFLLIWTSHLTKIHEENFFFSVTIVLLYTVVINSTLFLVLVKNPQCNTGLLRI